MGLKSSKHHKSYISHPPAYDQLNYDTAVIDVINTTTNTITNITNITNNDSIIPQTSINDKPSTKKGNIFDIPITMVETPIKLSQLNEDMAKFKEEQLNAYKESYIRICTRRIATTNAALKNSYKQGYITINMATHENTKIRCPLMPSEKYVSSKLDNELMNAVFKFIKESYKDYVFETIDHDDCHIHAKMYMSHTKYSDR